MNSIPELLEHVSRAGGDGAANGGGLPAGQDERVHILQVGRLPYLHALDSVQRNLEVLMHFCTLNIDFKRDHGNFDIVPL